MGRAPGSFSADRFSRYDGCSGLADAGVGVDLLGAVADGPRVEVGGDKGGGKGGMAESSPHPHHPRDLICRV